MEYVSPQFSDLGSVGWELVAVTSSPMPGEQSWTVSLTATFKRPLVVASGRPFP